MKLIFMLMCLLMFFGATGCESQQVVATAPATTQPHAECLVCKEEADLACVDVTVDPTTPMTLYQGQSYYFCSDHCKNKFIKSPGTYVKP